MQSILTPIMTHDDGSDTISVCVRILQASLLTGA